jgi:hypothetical protein
MSNPKQIVMDYIFKNMPMPKGTVIQGEGGGPLKTKKGVIIKRNLFLDVTARLKKGIPPYPEASKDDVEIESYYLDFNYDLLRDMWTIISEFCPGQVMQYSLGGERGEDTMIYCNDDCAVVLRARFDCWKEGMTTWRLDMVVSIRC